MELPKSPVCGYVLLSDLSGSSLKKPTVRACHYYLTQSSLTTNNFLPGDLSKIIISNCLTFQLPEVVIIVDANKKLTKKLKRVFGG